MLASCVVAFDHVRRTMSVIGPADEAGAGAGGAAAPIAAGGGARPGRPRGARPAASATWTRSGRAKEYIAAGDAFQIVLARVRRATGRLPFDVYRALRAVNPSPYMYFLLRHAASHQLVGTSPGDARAARPDGTCELRPIAGTRPRAADRARTTPLARSCSPPRRSAPSTSCWSISGATTWAGREPGSVRVARNMEVERYSHVMHIVSEVTGSCAPTATPADAAARDLPRRHAVRRAEGARDADHPRARGPAARRLRRRGRLPRLRRRHGFRIAIRTIAMRDGVAYLQAGAGIVADSDLRRSTTRARTRWRRWRRASTRPRRGSTGREGARDRQLRLVHLQPGALHRLAPAPRCASSATTRSRPTRPTAAADARRRLARPGHARARRASRRP